jgi:succinoglycan biosynthesis transport protein ExoP
MAFWEEQGEDAARFLSDLKTRQAQLTTELNRLETQGAEALLSSSTAGSGSVAAPRAQPVEGDTVSAGVYGGGDVMAQYTVFKQQLVAKQAELAERSRVWRPAHPGIEMIKTEISGIQRSIDAVKDLTREAAEGRMAEIRLALVALDEDIAKWQKKALEASRLNSEAERLKGQVTRIDNRYEKLLTSINQMDMSKEISRDPLMISQHASPASRVPPQTVKHLLTGGVIGLLCGLAILYFIDRSDDRIASATEMIETFPESILGQIPKVDAPRKNGGLPLLGPEDQRYMFAESFRSLRSSLVFMPSKGDLKTLIITSAIPGEGKSTIASNLAITMALAGAKVLLVDADLRRGDLASLFDIDGRFGFSNVLRGDIPWRSAVQPTRHQKLSILPRGPVTNQSAELLLVPLLEQLLTDFKNGYDLTIFNTSPILATDDASTLAPNFDGTLMILRAGFTPSRLTRNALKTLYQRQVNVLGMILNCVNTEMPDYYYYRYPKYYAA